MAWNEIEPLPGVVYHGTDAASARSIVSGGVDIKRCSPGYFGIGFYTAIDFDLAKSNYADFSHEDDENGVVLRFEIDPKARVLDLRKDQDYGVYMRLSGNGKLIGQRDFDRIMREAGVDGLYDNSFGGIVFFNGAALGRATIEECDNQTPQRGLSPKG